MTEHVTEEVKDPQGLLKAYRELQQTVVSLRNEKKELETQLENTSEDAVNEWKKRAVKAEAKVALQGQGIKDTDRLMKYLNLDGVDFDDEGNLSGLDEKVSEVKADFPELFDVKKRAGRSSADIHEKQPAKEEKSTTEMQVDSLFAAS